MSPLSSWLDELLACEDDHLPDELVDRILARGDAARAELLDVATSPEHRGYGSMGDGLAAVHALDVLAEMPPDDATAARLVRSIVEDPESSVASEVADALLAMGDVAVAPARDALSGTTHPDAATMLSDVVGRSRVRDDATFAALAAAFERLPAEIAPALADYGDARAIPILRRAVAAHSVEAGRPSAYEDRCIESAQAIEALGGELTPEETEKVERSLARQERLRARSAARRQLGDDDFDPAPPPADAPRPNDPCPCGSGRKFKKCCEGDDAIPADAPDDG